MSSGSDILVLPRPQGPAASPQAPISGPSEAAFTSAFGSLLPPAKFLATSTGKAAYYEFPPASPGTSSQTPDRVLFIHGVQTPALGMFPLARALQKSFPHAHFVLVDLWGHGLSDTPVAPHDAELFHQLLDNLLDRLSWESAHLVGFSFGASLTTGYAASHPSRVESFVLVAPAGLLHAADFTPEERDLLRGENVDEAAARRFVLNFLEGGELVVPADWEEKVAEGEVVAEAVREWQMREHPGHAGSVVAIFRDGGVLDNDAQFVRAVGTGIPSLAVLGGLDDLCNEGQLKELGLTNVGVVPDVGHGVVRERVPEVAAYISPFWRDLARRT
ncbi:putative 2-succinyl-6-hydroxy-2,4-cyclohexadiene-1-carboxylate synthase [Colletotrichum orbiculare MAFF 240422]|uniref:2-succinyl-6-hydroxy-2,4-cyclohexadiene-1-carboxylate synthase n=1 Tax=Colletotrichum orbiculare (strain 104-T / ATCC 96160 / CBS 514.97 / LARS 414 / MAFF 240422) TaxID=1213857 RepID=N4VLP9_COLOR|nr:putative 2-succinyl-6-hydroxy-2,4-cyclohexadiene-1-carboxylate synthase [Colletotrichum orbiculare MAFF 240422]